MDCRAARLLLDQGLRPGHSDPTRASLGFHLAQCAACRAYLQDPAAQVLRELLAQPPSVPLRRRQRRPYSGRGLVLALTAAIALVATLLLGRTALALVTIQQNYAAMRLPPTAALVRAATPAPAARPDTSAPLPAGGAGVAPTAAPATPAETTEAAPSPAPTAEPRLPTAIPPEQLRIPTPILLPLGGLPRPMPTAADRALPVPSLMPTAFPTPMGVDQALTVLLLGIDQRPDESYPARSDAIAIVRIDPQRGRVAILSLPRDLIVNIPGHGYNRINAASVVGEISGVGGVELTRQTVSQLIGAPIDYAVHANFMGFIGVVDSIGGVEIDVARELYDPQYPTMDYGYTIAHFLPGRQHMNGETALMYGRVRHMDSDFERMKRQQQVLVAIVERVRSQNPLEQVQTVAGITSALRDYVQTDLPQERLLALAWSLRDFPLDRVERYVLDANMVSQGVIAGDPYAQLALPGAIESLAAQLLYGGRAP